MDPPSLEPDRLSREALAERAGVDVAAIDRLVEHGVLFPADGDEPFTQGDVHRVRFVSACELAGMPAAAIGRAIAEGRVSLSFMDLPHYRWSTLADLTYEELAERMQLPIELVLDVAQSMGSTRRLPSDRIREDELEIFPLVRLAATVFDRDALLRTARVYADAMRRIVDAEAALFEKFVLGAFVRRGMSYREAVDAANAFGAESTPLQERMVLVAYRRQQERAWNALTVEGIEGVLDQMGLYERPARPPAFAFVDLAGFTALTEQHGDEASARLAADLGHVVDRVTTEAGGKPIKWLGDGVMVHFRDPGDAVEATLEVVHRAPELGLPAHAGVAAGPAVFQDGDYFGRTVNLAARIAAVASAGQTLVSGEVVGPASGRGFTFTEMGEVELKGFGSPVPVFEASRAP